MDFRIFGFFGRHFPSKCASSTQPVDKIKPPGIRQRLPRVLAEMGFGPGLGTHPSTRAGDQDDVSSKQTPSNYLFRILVILISYDAHTYFIFLPY